MHSAGESLLIRADASTQIGTGHVMRCLALAQAWQDTGGRVIFAMAMKAPDLEARFRAEGMDVVYLSAQPGSADDATQAMALARQESAAWIVVDGYHFGAEYQYVIKGSGLNLLFIDDRGHAEHYYADLVLNQNISASDALYANRESYTQLLLGTRYVLLRREFLRWQGWKREIPEVARKVLVTLGGGDPDKQTLKIIHSLQQVSVDGLEAVVVVGASNPHFHELQSAICNLQSSRLVRNATDIPELMAWADVAVSAGGSTCWEMAFMGLPSCTMILADNQTEVAEMLHEQEVSINMGWFSSVGPTKIADVVSGLIRDEQRRSHMSNQGRAIVPEWGTAHIVSVISGKFRRA